ncbi:DUF4269 domain-containing protein [Rossellomorea sp. AcN35-11]|nr:DUF4269 domain-containing protein [Rossellomorea aquimaris]WJV31166.1 DUF4269 domain-containing protein [Rossellomorea sp. AcN35-11]
MSDLFENMKTGNEKQQSAYSAIIELDVLNQWSSYSLVLCGTLPIGIDISGSDLDIIMEVHDLDLFEEKLQKAYNCLDGFTLKRSRQKGREVVIANFIFRDFEFELFGQAQPVHKQHAYLHMMIEHKLLQTFPALKQKVIHLKQQGYKTEPAFCKLLDITGDPYEGLIRFGVEKGIIPKQTIYV